MADPPIRGCRTTRIRNFALGLVKLISLQEGVMIPLSQFKEGDRGVIIKVQGSGAFRKRLQEMGFIKGTEVIVEKYAPLRDPVELIVKGYHVSLRVEEAAQVLMDRRVQEGE
jgi:Fe2+ transport system protein FeoA